jgi:SAM-dependent methyltransferase|tara:strand:+ start:396 stop:1295 length:900 start_codon:yes stop_codon:yes gene_type:complete
MSAIASTRVVHSARQPTLGSGNERRRPTTGCCIAARSRIADGASLRTKTIARLPTRRVTDGARCLAGPEQLFQLADGGGLSPIVPLVSILGGFAIARAVVYWRVQFITASMIGRHVPPGARRVLEYGVGQGRNLYYYPKNTGMVVGVDPDAKEDLLIQVSVAAGVPFVAKAQPCEAPNNQPDGSVDAVITTGALGTSEDPAAIVREAARALKPGAPLVFVEDMSFGKGGVIDAVEALDDFERAEYDDGWATLPLLPHAIGVAVKRDTDASNKGATSEAGDDFESSTGLAGKRSKKRRPR